jgi:hypothetical protein
MIRLLIRLLCVAMVCATILVVAFFVWPTPYYYETVRRPYFSQSGVTHTEEVYRVHRVTGDATKVLDTNPRASSVFR